MESENVLLDMLVDSRKALEDARRQIIDNAVCYFFLDTKFVEAFREKFGIDPDEWMSSDEAQDFMNAQPTESPVRRDYEDLRYEAKRVLYNF